MFGSAKENIEPIASAALTELSPDRVTFVAIGPDAEGQRLDNFLFKKAKGRPEGTRLPRDPRGRSARLEKKRAKAETKLALGDVVHIPPMRTTPAAQRARLRGADRRGAAPRPL